MCGETHCSASWLDDLNALGFQQVDEATGEMPDALDSAVRLVLTHHPATAGHRPVEFEQSFPIRCAVIFEREAERYPAGPIVNQQFNPPMRKVMFAIAAMFRLRATQPAENDEEARSHFDHLRLVASVNLRTAARLQQRNQAAA